MSFWTLQMPSVQKQVIGCYVILLRQISYGAVEP